jgi:HTH-type transcriptional regulator/antitoxin MqsA
MNEACYECGGSVAEERGPQNVQVGDRTVTVEADYLRCEACGEVVYRPGQMREMQRAAVELVRREDGLLAPADIEAIRAGHGLSQTAFERLINAGPKTVTRWERGTVAPNGTADTLLKLLRDKPEIVRHLARQRGVELRTEVRRTA